MLLCELSIVHESSLVADPVRQRMRWATGRRPIALQGIHLQNYMLRRILPCVRGTALARPLARPTAPTGGRGMGWGLPLSGVSPILLLVRDSSVT